MSTVSQLNTATDHEARRQVATNVRAFIGAAGISKSATARGIGMTQSTFSRRANGLDAFDVDELGQLANFFGVTLVDIVTGNVSAMPPENEKMPPTPKGGGLKLPELDSNQQPAGKQPAPVIALPLRPAMTAETNELATVTELFA